MMKRYIVYNDNVQVKKMCLTNSDKVQTYAKEGDVVLLMGDRALYVAVSWEIFSLSTVKTCSWKNRSSEQKRPRSQACH